MSTPLLVHNVDLILPVWGRKHGWILCSEGKIQSLAFGAPPSLENVSTRDGHGNTLLPGFIDIHVHGGIGYEVMDASPEIIPALSRFYAEHGVTSFLATTWTDSREHILAALHSIASALDRPQDGAQLIGAHLEGPYLNVEKCGAQNAAHIRTAARDEALSFLDTGVIKLVSLAPEIKENQWLIGECRRRGIAVSAAHTSASYDEMRHAIELGISQTTHTFNAMTGLHHREPGTLGAALAFDELQCELIADTVHVHPGAMHILYKAKGVDRVILISDAVRGAGLEDNEEYMLDDRRVVVKDGAARLADGTLAGSTLTLDRGMSNLMMATGKSLEDIWQTSSLNAARAIGISAHKGSIEIGKDADLVLVDEQVNVMATIVGGNLVYDAAHP